MKDNTPQAPARNYTGPFITMVFLFFIVGFLTTANTQFQIPLQQTFLAGVDNLKNTFSTLIIFSWFLAYPICGGTGSRWISRYGYKGTLLLSLLVMIVGLALFYASSLFTVKFPDAALTVGNASIQWGFFIFLAGSFVLGASVTILQVVVNPYLTACTVRGTQPIQRLAIGGSANSVGTTIAPYFVTGVVFAGLPMSEISIDQLMVPFLGLIAVVAVVYASLYFTSLPDIEGTRIDRSEANAATDTNVWRHRHFLLGVVAIFCYVGAEVCIGGSVNVYAEKLGYSETQFVLMVTIYWGLMLIGRLCGSTLSKISPRTQLIVTTACAAVLVALAVIFQNPWLLVAVGLFHSIMWGAIFTLSVSGLGKLTSIASGKFMIGVFGGALFPLLQGFLADSFGSWRFTWLLVLACEAVMLYYAIAGSKVKSTPESK